LFPCVHAPVVFGRRPATSNRSSRATAIGRSSRARHGGVDEAEVLPDREFASPVAKRAAPRLVFNREFGCPLHGDALGQLPTSGVTSGAK